ncbi:dehydrogenase/reductase SDR family member 7B-like [Panonychus citri]|uniref:dehydrogenase/reductase SDR family member 7B-like n=1 Tax=Panonychus citri TaxID=50023 RepID=UPI0023072002|nr:dehydrogenase/reductase SDR family member 7B-like [Panonychus citri]XP_053200941.1 dehydrogenase/reductase SDR family member 7B-like [Panonychus citri]
MSIFNQLHWLLPVSSFSWLIYVLTHKFAKLRYKESFKGKVIIITGASSGLGEALARVFHRFGAKLIIAARNVEKLTALRDELVELYPEGFRPIPLKLDLTKIQDIRQIAQSAISIHGKVDILINNAGISYRGTIMSTDSTVYQSLMTVNYFGQIEVIKAITEHFVSVGKGTIVGVGSVQSQISIPYRSAYSASKHAFQAFIDCLRAELSSVRPEINVITVNPGYIKTNLSVNALSSDGSLYNKMDETTASGMDPNVVADEIALAIYQQRKELIMSPLSHKLAIILRYMFPSLFFILMSKRAKKQ